MDIGEAKLVSMKVAELDAIKNKISILKTEGSYINEISLSVSQVDKNREALAIFDKDAQLIVDVILQHYMRKAQDLTEYIESL